ncbi:MAG TPA: hypothetical protein VHQ65_00835 [Thermoanaerobaculia bacterium]|nr:hypothetical protein [Thermoanaerobaculia bacterium]
MNAPQALGAGAREARGPWFRRSLSRTGLALARQLGADAAELVPLARALSRDLAWRQQQAMAKGQLSAVAAKVLVGTLLGTGGLALGVAVLLDRQDPVAAAALVLASTGVVLVALLLWELYHALLGDEDFRVIASWPVASQSFLLARLLMPLRDATGAAVLLAGPASLVLAFAHPPGLPGLALLAVTVLLAAACTFLVAALYTVLLRRVGVRVLRLIGGVLPLVAGLSLGVLLETLGSSSRAAADLPAASPLSWLLAPVALAAGRFEPRVLGLAAVGAALLVVLPLAAFRSTAARYAAGLGPGRRSRRRGRLGQAVVALYGRLARRPTDHVVARLALAHLRGDWRFQSQLFALLVLAAYFGWAAVSGQDSLARLFRDPRAQDGLLHPGMMLLWITVLPALLAVPLLSVSSDPQGAWLLRLGPFTTAQYAAAARRLVWGFLLLPLFAVLAAGYAVAGAPAISVAAHLALLALASDLALVALQRAWAPLPFSIDQREAQAHLRLVAFALVLMFLVPITALVVFHVAYRWWAGYVVVMAGLAAVRRAVGRGMGSEA